MSSGKGGMYWEVRKDWVCPRCGYKENTSGHFCIRYCKRCRERMREEDDAAR